MAWRCYSRREAGALSELPIALSSRVWLHLFAGELDLAGALVEELEAVNEATGSELAPYGSLGVIGWRGREGEASELIEASMREVVARGEKVGVTTARWAAAVVYNGLGRCADALPAAQEASEFAHELATAGKYGLVELVEAAARSGNAELAAHGLQRLAETTRAADTDWALGIEARSRALLSDGDTAERLYREAIGRLARTRVRVELARARLLYGEWLRRKNRRLDAREQLRTANDMFIAMDLVAFADRAARELLATGETAANAPARQAASSPPRRRRSPGSPATASPTPRSAPGCSSAPAPSSTTCTRSSPSSTSARAASSTGRSPANPTRPSRSRKDRVLPR
jgi:hypothetical protein